MASKQESNDIDMALPQLRFPVGAIVTPGDRLGSVRAVTPGVGTYARGGHVFASSVGTLECQPVVSTAASAATTTSATTATDRKPVLRVISSKGLPAVSQVILKGQLVLCQVTRIMLQQVAVEIIIAGTAQRASQTRNSTAGSRPEGTIRREDVKHGTASAEELDLECCFRPGDWVLGRIVSLGDARRYLISTAEPELGVVRALSTSMSGQPQHHPSQHVMKPISFKEMKCPVTGRTEPRKVAKASQRMLQQVLMGSR